MLRAVTGDIAGESPDGGQALVAGPRGAAPVRFQMGQEGEHAIRAEIPHLQLVNRPPGLSGDEWQQQAERVAVAELGVASQIALGREMFLEEPAQPGAETAGVRHGALPPGCEIGLKTQRGGFQQFRDHAQIGLRAGHAGMAEVGGQRRQQALHVGPFGIPCDEPMDGKRSTQVVQARLVTCLVGAADPGCPPQLDEGLAECGGSQRGAVTIRKDGASAACERPAALRCAAYCSMARTSCGPSGTRRVL